MQKIKFLLLIGIIFSCNSQNKKDIDIKGNWYTYSIKNIDTILYVETFIGDKAFHYYDQNFGMNNPEAEPSRYQTEKNLFLVL